MHRWRPAVVVASTAVVLAVPIAAMAAGASPAVVPTTTMLGPKPTDPGPGAMDPAGLVLQARAGLEAFATAYPVESEDGGEIDLAECPLATPAELTAVLAPIGDASTLEPEIEASLEFEAAGAIRTSTVLCDTEDSDAPAAGPIYGLGLGVGVLGEDAADFEEIADLAESLDAIVVEPSPETFGGTLYVWCEPEDDDPVETTRCFPLWLHPDLLVAMFVTVDEEAEATTRSALESTFLTYLPVLLQRVAAGLPQVPVAADEPDPTVVDEAPSTSTVVVTPTSYATVPVSSTTPPTKPTGGGPTTTTEL